jgi:transcriptional regulator with XRE-family HTH domain
MKTAAFSTEARRLRRESGLTAEQIARATGAAPSTVRGWIGRHSEPKGRRAERVAELAAITERLERVMPRSYVPVWLSKPIEALGYDKPLDLIAAGEYRRVARAISAIEDPGAV